MGKKAGRNGAVRERERILPILSFVFVAVRKGFCATKNGVINRLSTILVVCVRRPFKVFRGAPSSANGLMGACGVCWANPKH